MLNEDRALIWISVLTAPDMENSQDVIVLGRHLHRFPLMVGELQVHYLSHILVNAHCFCLRCLCFAFFWFLVFVIKLKNRAVYIVMTVGSEL